MRVTDMFIEQYRTPQTRYFTPTSYDTNVHCLLQESDEAQTRSAQLHTGRHVRAISSFMISFVPP